MNDSHPVLTPHQPRDPHDPDDLGFVLPAPATTSRAWVIAAVVVVVGGAFAYGYMKHRAAAEQIAPPILTPGEVHALRVQVFHAKPVLSDQAIDLPASVKALEQATLYPRASGYIKAWHADIGDKVAAGTVLAEIDIPDLDAQLGQARAQLLAAKAAIKQAQAQSTYSKSNAVRYVGLGEQKLVAQQTVDQNVSQAAVDEATVAADQANAAAAEANVRKLEEQVRFSKVVAPFAGTITARDIDRGALVTADGSATPLFNIVATDPVRVFVDVPQNVAPSIHQGADVTITAREYPNRPFTGKVVRDAGAYDPDLHTLSTEVDVPNPDGALKPGMYVRAALSLPVPHAVYEIPPSALYADASGTRVATVGPDSKVHYVKIGIERDTGGALQVATGIDGSEKILRVAVPSLVDGDPVEVVEEPAAGSGSAGAR
jgi:RND family efflux transporter MFP subunit